MKRARAQLESEVYPVSADILQDSLDKVITSLDRISYIDSTSDNNDKSTRNILILILLIIVIIHTK